MHVLIVFLVFITGREAVNNNVSFTTATESFNKRETMTYLDSCQGRCGQEKDMPCSCDVKCSVYKNCCEDMEQYCIHIKQETLRKFPKLLNLDMVCTTNDYLLISGCSGVSENSHGHLDSLFNETRDFMKTKPTQWQGNSMFNEVLNRIPVTDSSTGFSFTNVSVFMCNAGSGSYPIKWSVHFNYMDLNLTGYSSPIEENSKLDVLFTPSSNVTNAARCASNSIASCEPNSDADVTAKCLAFKSYVTLPMTFPETTYNNKYCAECNGHNSSANLVPKENMSEKHKFIFRIISSFEDNAIKFSSLDEEDVSWSNFQCVLTESKEIVAFPDSYRCELMACKTGFHKRPDGQCKELYVLKLGLSTSAFSFDLGEFQKLTNVLRCVLTSYTELETIGQWKPFRMRYDQRLNLNVMVTELVVYLTQESSKDFNNADPSIHIKTITLIVRKIQHLKKILLWPHRRTRSYNKLEVIQSLDFESSFQTDRNANKLFQNMNQSKASVCNCILPFTQVGFLEDADCTLKCLHFDDDLNSGDFIEDNERFRGNCDAFNKANGPRYKELCISIMLSCLLNMFLV